MIDEAEYARQLEESVAAAPAMTESRRARMAAIFAAGDSAAA